MPIRKQQQTGGLIGQKRSPVSTSNASSTYIAVSSGGGSSCGDKVSCNRVASCISTDLITQLSLLTVVNNEIGKPNTGILTNFTTAVVNAYESHIAAGGGDPEFCGEMLACLQNATQPLRDAFISILNTALATTPNPLLPNLCTYINKCIDDGLLVVSANAGNLLTTGTDGGALLLASALPTTTVTDTNSINLTKVGNNISADLIINPATDNLIKVTGAGVFADADAAAHNYSNAASGLTAINVQSAIDELDGKLDATCNGAPVSATNKIITTGSLSSNVDLPTNILDNSVDLNKRYKKTIKVNTGCSDDEYYETCPCGGYFMTLKRQNIGFRVFLLGFGPGGNSPLFGDTGNINEQPRYEPTTGTIYGYDANIISTGNTFRQFVEYCVSFIPQSYGANIINVLHGGSDNATILIKFKSIEGGLMGFFGESIFIADRDCCEPQIQGERFTTQPDYNNNDTTSPNYIANKPPILLANNGLDVDGTNVVLGQDVGEAGDPAKLLNNREIPMVGKRLDLIGQFGDRTIFDGVNGHLYVGGEALTINSGDGAGQLMGTFSLFNRQAKGNSNQGLRITEYVGGDGNPFIGADEVVDFAYPQDAAGNNQRFEAFRGLRYKRDLAGNIVSSQNFLNSDNGLYTFGASNGPFLLTNNFLPPISSSATVESLAIDTANGQIVRKASNIGSYDVIQLPGIIYGASGGIHQAFGSVLPSFTIIRPSIIVVSYTIELNKYGFASGVFMVNGCGVYFNSANISNPEIKFDPAGSYGSAIVPDALNSPWNFSATGSVLLQPGTYSPGVCWYLSNSTSFVEANPHQKITVSWIG